MPVAIISGEAGTVWTNTTGKVLFQLHVDFVRSCALCIQFAGRIGPYWPVPYHDHCLLPGNRVIAPGLKSALTTRYDGRALRLRFRGGSTVSVTPNHMLATPIGFMKASSIVAGDDVVCGLFGEAEMLRHPYHDRHPSLIEDVVNSLAVSGRVVSRSVPATAEDLHGDGASCQGNIDVVTADGLLFDDFDPAILKHPDELRFRRTYPDRPVVLATPGGLSGMLFALRDATDGGMGRLREFKASLLGHLRESVGLGFGATANCHVPSHEDLSDPSPGYSEVIRQRKLGFSGDVAVNDLGMHDRWRTVPELLSFRVGSELDSTVGEAARHYLGCDTQRLRDARNRLSGQVSTLKVVAVESMHYVGPVYDLETESTLYTLDGGIVSSNCHCRNIPIKPGATAMPFIDYQEELRQLGPVAQRNAMGASNWRLVESGLAKWEDVVTKGRVRDFREVADRLDLGVDRMVKAGVRPDLARKAYDATHTEAHAASAKDRAALIKGLKAHGVKDERIAAEVGDLLATRVGVIGPGGAKTVIIPTPDRPKPGKTGPKSARPSRKPGKPKSSTAGLTFRLAPDSGPDWSPSATLDDAIAWGRARGVYVIPDSPLPVTLEMINEVNRNVSLMPARMLREIEQAGLRMDVLAGRGITDHPKLHNLRGVTPRGWPEGSTWDDVPGAGSGGATQATVIVANRLREGHGSENLVIHEHVHTYDHAVEKLTGTSVSDSPEWRAVHARAEWRTAYERNYREEGFVESVAKYYGAEGNRDTIDPDVRSFIERHFGEPGS